MTVDVLYFAWNRRAFTEHTFAHLIANTDWEHVDRLLVYDDGSKDGTRELLDDMIGNAPVPSHLTHCGWGSPVAIMNHYLSSGPADVFAKVDNDIAVPAGWLDTMLGVIDRNPDVELLGMEAGQTDRPDPDPWDGVYRLQPSSHIGGVGLMRASAFLSRPPMVAYGRHGFTNWQHDHEPVRGWITPDLPVPQLDRIPEQPWLALSDIYRKKLWQRPWPLYDPSWQSSYWDWMTVEAVA